MRRELFSRQSLGQFQTFSLVLLQVGWRLTSNEMSFHIFCLVVLLIQFMYPNNQRKSVYRPSRLKCRLSSVSRLINITFVLKIVYVGSVSQWGKKGTMYTLISYCLYGYVQKKNA